MNTNGFFIRELRLIGDNLPFASVTFKKGLNVIYGPSDTGKSFIFQCINYMFGWSKLPKKIDEAKGYTDILLEIETYSGTNYTFKRTMKSDEIIAYNCKMDEIEDCNAYKILKSQHSANNQDTISYFLLGLTGVENWLIRRNDRGMKRTFSFRDFVHLSLISESKIITEDSPVLFSGQYTKRTAEKSVFKAVMTGVDDSECGEVEDIKLYRARTLGKIEIVDAFIKDVNIEIETLETIIKAQDINLDDIENRISEIEGIISSYSKLINEKMTIKNALWEEEQKSGSRIIMLKELLARFELLREHYITDLKRLEFISEGQHYISQLEDVPCPLCHNEIKESFIHNMDDISFESTDIKNACSIEINKIAIQLNDLESTVISLNEELIELNTIVEEKRKEIYEYEREINESLKPISIVAKNELESLIIKRKKVQELELAKKRLIKLYTEKAVLNDALRRKKEKVTYKGDITNEVYNDFCSVISQILDSWNYTYSRDVDFDINIQDIRVSGKERNSHGKGYRAILYSAFIIALMKYVIDEDLKHPGFVILDSPLTTLKEKEKTLTENEDVPLTMQQSFFNSLANIGDNKQVIIFENKEPSDELQSRINYIHFTQQVGIGRYGFIPK